MAEIDVSPTENTYTLHVMGRYQRTWTKSINPVVEAHLMLFLGGV